MEEAKSSAQVGRILGGGVEEKEKSALTGGNVTVRVCSKAVSARKRTIARSGVRSISLWAETNDQLGLPRRSQHSTKRRK
ncbi:hypothetical protein HPP92_009043 [Vanilla planifolia]|uniref:Uncharacterized protein n=1 Tax=Vanilla planifolia TaxID=51239 RepID=A0A835RII8_VANPL|nr:hypothetical protein HPP92_009043 [Vanilla planifolia]